MPTYEYRCRACGHGFDIVQSFKDESLTICPACGGELRKVYGAPAISFKGSGFYATDNRRKAPSGSEDSKDAKPSEGSKDAKTTSEGSSSSSADSGGSSETSTKKKDAPAPAPAKGSKDP
jgi:putative FmdB family regulatory protein